MTLLFGFNNHSLLANFQGFCTWFCITHWYWILLFLDCFLCAEQFQFNLQNWKRQFISEYSHVVGVNELVLGAPWVVGGGGIAGGVSLDCVFTSTGESGIVECFSVRSGNATRNTLFHSLNIPVLKLRSAFFRGTQIQEIQCLLSVKYAYLWKFKAEFFQSSPTWEGVAQMAGPHL